jgi:hypothetical protein
MTRLTIRTSWTRWAAATVAVWTLLAVVPTGAPKAVAGGEMGRPSYAVQGTVCFTNFAADGSRVVGTRSAFELVVSGCRWSMRIVPEDRDVVDYYALAFDGTNVYQYVNMDRAIFLRRQKGETVGDNTGLGAVINGPIPHFVSVHEASPIWLAYASACYWSAEGNGLVEPCAVLRVNSGNNLEPGQILHQAATWRLTPGEPHLPEWVCYMDDGVFRAPGSSVPHPTVLMPEGYRRGFTNTLFEATGVQAFDGLRLPKRGILKTFWPKDPRGQSTDLQVVAEYTISANAAQRTNSDIAFPTRVSGPTFFTDYRFAHDKVPLQRVQYLRSDAFPTKAQVMGFPEFAAAAQREGQLPHKDAPLRGHAQAKRSVRLFFLGAMITSLAVFLLIISKQRKRQAKGRT